MFRHWVPWVICLFTSFMLCDGSSVNMRWYDAGQPIQSCKRYCFESAHDAHFLKRERSHSFALSPTCSFSWLCVSKLTSFHSSWKAWNLYQTVIWHAPCPPSFFSDSPFLLLGFSIEQKLVCYFIWGDSSYYWLCLMIRIDVFDGGPRFFAIVGHVSVSYRFHVNGYQSMLGFKYWVYDWPSEVRTVTCRDKSQVRIVSSSPACTLEGSIIFGIIQNSEVYGWSPLLRCFCLHLSGHIPRWCSDC